MTVLQSTIVIQLVVFLLTASGLLLLYIGKVWEGVGVLVYGLIVTGYDIRHRNVDIIIANLRKNRLGRTKKLLDKLDKPGWLARRTRYDYLSCYGDYHYAMEEYDEACRYYLQAQRIEGKDPYHRIMLRLALSGCYAETGQSTASDTYYDEALVIAESWLADTRKPYRSAWNYLSLSFALNEIKRRQDARVYLNRAKETLNDHYLNHGKKPPAHRALDETIQDLDRKLINEPASDDDSPTAF